MKKNVLITLGIGFMILIFGIVVVTFKTSANGYVAIDINPSVEFVTNRNNKVLKVNALNEDGEILIADEDFVGMDVSDACEQVIGLAIELGYLDVDATENDPNAVMVTTLHRSSRIANQLRGRIYQRLDQYFMNNGVWAIILTDETLDDLVQETENLGISSGKLRLIKSIQTVDSSFDTEEGAKMSVKGLLDIIRDKKPFIAKIEALQSRKDEINTLLETLDEVEDSEEIALLTQELEEINQQLEEIDLIKEKINQDKLELKNRVRNRIMEWRQNRPNRRHHWQQFKDSLTEEQKQLIKRHIFQEMQRRR